MKKILLSFIVCLLAFTTHAQEVDLKEAVSQLQEYLDGVEENATIVISDEGIVTYTKRFADIDNDYRAVFRITDVDILLEEVKAENYLEGEPKYYMKFVCEDKNNRCIIYTKLTDESSTNSYKFTNFPVWTLENGEDAVKKLRMLKGQFE